MHHHTNSTKCSIYPVVLFAASSIFVIFVIVYTKGKGQFLPCRLGRCLCGSSSRLCACLAVGVGVGSFRRCLMIMLQQGCQLDTVQRQTFFKFDISTCFDFHLLMNRMASIEQDGQVVVGWVRFGRHHLLLLLLFQSLLDLGRQTHIFFFQKFKVFLSHIDGWLVFEWMVGGSLY